MYANRIFSQCRIVRILFQNTPDSQLIHEYNSHLLENLSSKFVCKSSLESMSYGSQSFLVTSNVTRFFVIYEES